MGKTCGITQPTYTQKDERMAIRENAKKMKIIQLVEIDSHYALNFFSYIHFN